MKNLKAKLRRDGGFTLVEMLIVVAIIAILIAVSIPMISANLEKAREATDNANERAAVGAAIIAYMDGTQEATTGIAADGGTSYYHITNGKGELKAAAPATKDAYGQSTLAGEVGDHVGCWIKLTVTPNGDVTAEWVKT